MNNSDTWADWDLFTLTEPVIKELIEMGNHAGKTKVSGDTVGEIEENFRKAFDSTLKEGSDEHK